MKKAMLLLSFALLLGANESYYDRGELVELKEVLTTRSIGTKEVKSFLTPSGQKVGITNDILVKCKVGVNCEDLFSQFNQANVSKLTDTIFVIKVENYDQIFSLSRDLYNSGKVEFAHPNFIKERILR
jgi:hypothetical protein